MTDRAARFWASSTWRPDTSNPAGIDFDADQNVYVANFNTNSVLKYAIDGAFLGTFCSNAGGNGFGLPLAIRFGPQHNLFCTSNATVGIYEFSGATGAFIRIFASGGGLSGATGLAFIPSGDLLVSSAGTNQILRYDSNGVFVGPFGSGVTLNNPTDLEVGPDGMLYAASTLANQVVRYDLSTEAGAVFATANLNRPIGLAFDAVGNLYVANQGVGNVRKYAPNGASLGVFVPVGSGGLNGPNYMGFVPAPRCFSCAGDANKDGALNADDIQTFENCLNTVPLAPTCGCADLNSDGAAGFDDVDPFVQALLNATSCP